MHLASKTALYAKILVAADKEVKNYSSINETPLNVHLATLGNITFYAFTLTSSFGARPKGEYKVQLSIPGQHKGEKAQLSLANETFTIISGYQRDEDVFVFWDAYAHLTFTYLQSLQVKGSCVWLAQLNKVSTCKRRLHGDRGTEIVVACRADAFLEGIQARMHFSAQRTNLRNESLWNTAL